MRIIANRNTTNDTYDRPGYMIWILQSIIKSSVIKPK